MNQLIASQLFVAIFGLIVRKICTQNILQQANNLKSVFNNEILILCNFV